MTCLYTVLNTPILLQYRYGMIRIYESKEESTNSYVGESKENLRFHKMSGVKALHFDFRSTNQYTDLVFHVIEIA